MKLTPKQIKWINEEHKTLVTKCKVYDKLEPGHLPAGHLGDRIRLMQIQIIIDLHNIEVPKNDKRDSVPASNENVDSSFVLSFGC